VEVQLNNGVTMPSLGIGLQRIKSGRSVQLTMHWALNYGCRRIDTAYSFGNEKDVGKVLRAVSLPRDEVFVATKLWNADHGYDHALHAFDQSLSDMRLDYVDLYLIQWPLAGHRDESWRALQRVYEEGYARAIGVCNYTVRHLEELLSWADVAPVVNQIEHSPFLQQRELREFCAGHGIQVDACTPLTHGKRLAEPRLVAVAERLGRSPAEVVLAWTLRHGLSAVFSSINQRHIRLNMQALDLELGPEDMAELDALEDGFRVNRDPSAEP